MPDEDARTPLEYRATRDDRADVRREHRRRSWNAFFLFIMMGSVFVGAVAAMLTLSGLFFAVMNAGRSSTPWPMLAWGATLAVALLVFAYWIEGFIKSD